MSFIDQTEKIFAGIAEFKFRAVVFGRDAFYIEGARPIKLDGSEMLFKAPDALITLVGDGLSVKELSGDCACIIGRVHSFSVTEL